MSLYEQYRMNIPIFVPSLDLLVDWHIKYNSMRERTWQGTYSAVRPNGSLIPAHPSQKGIPDPNNDLDKNAIRYWLKFADYYHHPHMVVYDSIPDLVKKLGSMTQAKLEEISKKMYRYNIRLKNELIGTWSKILRKVAKYSKNNPH